jgi:polysaccharide biosynthesis transport protein
MAILVGPLTEEERLDVMVGLLEDRLTIEPTAEGAVTFSLNWPDGQVGYQIVDRAIQNFLTVRKQSETSAIADSIAILDRSVQTLEAQVSQTMAELPKRPTAGPRRVAAPGANLVIPPGPPAEFVARATKLKSTLDARKEEIGRLDNFRQQQLAEAEGRLAAAAAIYTEGHPTIVALRQNIAQLRREPAELTAARREFQTIETEYDAVNLAIQGQRDEVARAAIAAGTPLPDAGLPAMDLGMLALGEVNDPVGLRLKVELAELATVRERANAARAELSSAQAGFKYQYTMIRPPQVPRQPASPNVPAIIAAGVLASIMLGIAAAVAVDIARGRILEPWQVERLVGIPVGVRL